MKIILLFLCVCFFSCQNKTEKGHAQAKAEKIADIESMGFPEGVELSNRKEIEDVSYSVYKVPSHALKKMFKENSEEYNGFSCFYLDIQIKNIPDIVNYPSTMYVNLNEKIQYLSFDLKNYITIEADGKTYNCINSTFDRTYGQVPYARFFLVFEHIKSPDKTLTFYDHYFNNGEINFKL